MKAPIVSGMCAARMYSTCHHTRAARMWAAHNFQIRAAHKQATYMRHTCHSYNSCTYPALASRICPKYIMQRASSTRAQQMPDMCMMWVARMLLICAACVLLTLLFCKGYHWIRLYIEQAVTWERDIPLSPSDGLLICHLPYGPTASFSLTHTVMRHDIPNVGTMSEAAPHLIFHNFNTKLGGRVGLTALIMAHCV